MPARARDVYLAARRTDLLRLAQLTPTNNVDNMPTVYSTPVRYLPHMYTGHPPAAGRSAAGTGRSDGGSIAASAESCQVTATTPPAVAMSLSAMFMKAAVRWSSFPMLLRSSKFRLELATIEPEVVDVAGYSAGRNSATPSLGEVAVSHPRT